MEIKFKKPPDKTGQEHNKQIYSHDTLRLTGRWSGGTGTQCFGHTSHLLFTHLSHVEYALNSLVCPAIGPLLFMVINGRPWQSSLPCFPSRKLKWWFSGNTNTCIGVAGFDRLPSATLLSSTAFVTDTTHQLLPTPRVKKKCGFPPRTFPSNRLPLDGTRIHWTV